MNAVLESLGWWLVDFAWVATVLLASAAMLRILLREPRGRVVLAWGTCLSLAAAGVLTALPAWPRIPVRGLLQSRPAPAAELVMFADEPLPALSAPEAMPPPPVDLVWLTPVEAPAASPTWQFGGMHIAILVWLASAVLAAAWIALGWWRMQRLVRRSQPAPEWIASELARISGLSKRSPQVRTSERLASAVALGALKPRIVLPLESAVESNAALVRAALAHEWAHIRHGDLWLLALERMLVPLLAMHPLFWWLRRATRHDQEVLADAAAAGEQPVEYAEALVAWAKRESPASSGLAALAMWEHPSNLSRRVRMILDPNRKQSLGRGRGWAVAFVALLLALVAGLSLVTLGPSIAQDELQPPVQAAVDLPQPPPGAPVRREKQQAIMLELTFLSLDPKALADQNVNLMEIFQSAAGREPARAQGMLTIDVDADRAAMLLDRLQKMQGVQITSRPKLMTISGREANIQIGGEVPLVEVEETADGSRRERRVEYKEFGTRLQVKPVVLPEDPRMIALEIYSDQTRLNRQKDEKGSEKYPLFSTQKIHFKATVEVGQTLVMLDPAEAMPADKTAAADKSREGVIIFLTPTKVEERFIEVYPNRTAAMLGATLRRRPTGVSQLAQADGEQDAALVEQLRNIRRAVEELAREREASRAENAALKAELEALKRQLEGLEPGAGLGIRLPAVRTEPPPVSAAAPATAPAPGQPAAALPASAANPALPSTVGAPRKPAPPAKPAPLMTRTYVFRSHKEAAEAAKSLTEVAKGERIEGVVHGIQLSDKTLTIIGTPSGLDKFHPALPAGTEIKESLVTPSGDTRFAEFHIGPPGTPLAASARQTNREQDRQMQQMRQTERRLLELDLQAAELELQAAQEDFNEAEALQKSNSISAQEVRAKRRTLDRAKIQLARIKVQLDALEKHPAEAPRNR